MKLFSIPLLQFVIIIAVFTLINGNDETEDYPTDGDISLCEEESSPSEETCKIHSDTDNACCFTELTIKDKETLSKCMKIPRNYRFSLDFIETITIDKNEYIPKFTCNQVSQTCGTNNPNQVF